MKAVIICAAIVALLAFACDETLTIPHVSLHGAENQKTVADTESITEYLVDPNGTNYASHTEYYGSQVPSEEKYKIIIQGFWNRQNVSISVSKEDALQSRDNIDPIIQAAVNSHAHRSAADNLTSWNDVLESVESHTNLSLVHLSVENSTFEQLEGPSMNSIHIHFTNDQGPIVENAKVAAITSLSILKSNRSIVFANTTIFDSDNLSRENLLLPVTLHELGHALGLGHSTNKFSIMYPTLQVRGKISIGEIGTCEYSAIQALYAEHSKSNYVPCG